jgi:hypothetical protein
MSFKFFIYYCAVLGGWAAFLVWGVNQMDSVKNMTVLWMKSGLIGGVLGALLAATIGGLDALLNATERERLVRILICALIGLVAGVVGGIIGQKLADIRAPLFLVAWVLVGTAIGVSIGVYDLLGGSSGGMRKVTNGVIGGLLGGLIGGLSSLAGELFHARTPKAIAFVALGASIGLFIGLAQVFLKEAWLKVEAGFKAGREMMLTKEQTTIGRAEGCDLGMFGDNQIEKQHARIRQQNGAYVLEDLGTPLGTFLNDQRLTRAMPLRNGDVIRLGNAILRFGEREKKK